MINFKEEASFPATQLERGDKYDNSVVYYLSTLPGDVFFVEKKGGAWIVTTGLVAVPEVIEPVAEKKTKKKKK